MGYLQQEMISKMDVDAQISDLKAQVESCDYLLRQKDGSIAYLNNVISVLAKFGEYVCEYIPDDAHREALTYTASNNQAGWSTDSCRETLVDYCFTTKDLHEHEYQVTVTIPVYFSMTVHATDEDHAYDVAHDEVGNMWLDDIINGYTCDVDGSEISITDIEEV